MGQSTDGPFQRVAGTGLVTATDLFVPGGSVASVYMVRAVKREVVAAGTYYNASQGVFA